MSVQTGVMDGNAAALNGELLREVAAAMGTPEQTRTGALDRHANAHDASHFSWFRKPWPSRKMLLKWPN